MKITIKRWGNSAGLPLSKFLRKHLHCDIGDSVQVQFIDDGLLIYSAKQPKYKLEELLSSCTVQNTQLDDSDVRWLNAVPLGREV